MPQGRLRKGFLNDFFHRFHCSGRNRKKETNWPKKTRGGLHLQNVNRKPKKFKFRTKMCLQGRGNISFNLAFTRIIIFLFRPHLWGEELYTQLGFFVQTILADRYTHCREMWVVSLKSLSNVELEIKFFFSNFAFFEELSRFKLLCEHVVFCSLLAWHCSI